MLCKKLAEASIVGIGIMQDSLDIKTETRLNESGNGLICDSCKLLYHIKDDVPVMLIDEAEKTG